MKKYTEVHKEKGAEQPKPTVKSGVACDEKNCKGEMLIMEPQTRHPQYHELRRASCGKCGWRGWV